MNVSVFSPMGATSYVSLDMATPKDVLFENAVIATLAKQYEKSPAQIMLRWAVQRNTIPISKSSSDSRMVENRSLFDFYLAKQEMDMIDSLNVNRRYNNPGAFCEAAFGTFCPIYE
jgi:diketogulonate reductase-like aldo/keto reductase